MIDSSLVGEAYKTFDNFSVGVISRSQNPADGFTKEKVNGPYRKTFQQ